MPEWRITLLRPARRYLERLTRDDQKRILDVLARLEHDPFAAGIKSLSGRGEWSLRVGNRRVILRLDRTQRQLVVIRIGPRGDVYKR